MSVHMFKKNINLNNRTMRKRKPCQKLIRHGSFLQTAFSYIAALQECLSYRSHFHFLVTLNQSASIQPRLVFCPGSYATKPILAPIHLPSRMVNSVPHLVYFLPSRL